MPLAFTEQHQPTQEWFQQSGFHRLRTAIHQRLAQLTSDFKEKYQPAASVSIPIPISIPIPSPIPSPDGCWLAWAETDPTKPLSVHCFDYFQKLDAPGTQKRRLLLLGQMSDCSDRSGLKPRAVSPSYPSDAL